MDNFKLGVGLGLLAAGLSVGCGGSDGGSGAGSCSAVTGCGGDVTGTWTISTFCLQASDIKTNEACGMVNIHNGAATATGTLSFNADGTQAQNLSVVVEESALFPTSCIASAAACTQAEAQANAQPGASDAHCSFSSSGCTCAFKATSPNVASGSYQISGTSLTFQNTGESPETDPYCVSGNKLTLESSDGAGNLVAITATK